MNTEAPDPTPATWQQAHRLGEDIDERDIASEADWGPLQANPPPSPNPPL